MYLPKPIKGFLLGRKGTDAFYRACVAEDQGEDKTYKFWDAISGITEERERVIEKTGSRLERWALNLGRLSRPLQILHISLSCGDLSEGQSYIH